MDIAKFLGLILILIVLLPPLALMGIRIMNWLVGFDSWAFKTFSSYMDFWNRILG